MKKKLKKVFILLLMIVLVIIPISYVNAETRNNNPLLREILINGETSQIEFDQFITDYVIGIEEEEINIEAIPDDPNASVEIIGNTKLNEGKNEIEIKVTAEDTKTTQSYYLHITRGDTEKANANLKILEIEGITLNPKFNNKDINYYIEYEGIIDSLNILAIPENEKAKIEIIGNENYNTGTIHVVKVLVTAEDEITTKTYQIIAKKAGEDAEDPRGLEKFEEEVLQTERQKNNYIIFIAVAFVIICIGVFIAIKKKKIKK